MPDLRRHLPPVDQLAADLSQGAPLLPVHQDCARAAIDIWRERLAGSEDLDATAVVEGVLATARDQLRTLTAEPLPRVINASGTVLHTGLGRAPLSDRAQAAAARVLTGYCQLEFDLDKGKRGDRQDHVSGLLRRLTGAEAALVVNNCAGATVLLLQALAQHRQVIVSRGELVEIGGSFRVPEIMGCAGCTLVEVGATNKTHLKDYARAITDDTALFMKVHRSNFTQAGFVTDVSTAELVELGRRRGVPVAVDQGSGCVSDLEPHGYQTPQVTAELQAGADIVACSGDKLLGGPQAGILLGSATMIDRCARHPLARALRCDKVTLAALAGTLQDHLLDDALQAVPGLRMLVADPASVRARAERLLQRVQEMTSASCMHLASCHGAVGPGALPTDGPDSTALILDLPEPSALHRRLRAGSPAVVGRIHEGRLLIDCCTVFDQDIDELATAVAALIDSPTG